LKHINLLVFTTVTLSCVKKEGEIVSIQEPSVPADYRDRFLGTYFGQNTDWQSIQGMTTYWVADSNLRDVITKSTDLDSVIISKWLGNFTITTTGASVKYGWNTTQVLSFKEDSLYYSYSDFSTLGGAYGNEYRAKKKNE